jgi:hypothetical protein
LGDPHLRFAHGGRADFRGVNGTSYALLSTRGLTYAATTMDHDFLLRNAKNGRQMYVHGSFFTEGHATVRLPSRQVRHVLFDAGRAGFAVLDSQHKLLAEHRGHAWQSYDEDNLHVLAKMLTLVIRADGWEVNATRKPIYNRLSGPYSSRFDIRMQPLNPAATANAVAPHGLIGQSFDGDGIAVDGALDDYTVPWGNTDVPHMTTKAMAEGAIEGVAADYALKDPYDPDFKFSRFGKTVAPKRVASKLSGFFRRRALPASAAVAGVEEHEEVPASLP